MEDVKNKLLDLSKEFELNNYSKEELSKFIKF